MTVAEQAEAPGPEGASVHVVDGANASPATEDERATVPVGLDFVPAASESVTVTVTVAPWPASAGFGETTTADAVPRLLTVSVRFPLLD